MSRISIFRPHETYDFIADGMAIQSVFDAPTANTWSLVRARLHGEHSTRVNSRSDKVYVILSGSGEFEDPVREVHEVRAGDTVLIPHGAEHRISGNGIEMLIFCAPSFDAADELVAPARNH